MKRVVAVALLAMLLLPGVAFAGSSTDAALGLGAFAALGTLLLGATLFGGHAAVAAPAPVYAPPPAVYAPPPAVYAPPIVYAPPPPPAVVYRPVPPPVVYGPRAVYSPAPRYDYRHGAYVRPDHRPYTRPGYWRAQ
jgi:hypothetical protein